MAGDKQIRVTVMLNSNLAQALRQIQAKRLLKAGKSVSFSSVLNAQLKKSLTVKADKKVKGAKVAKTLKK